MIRGIAATLLRIGAVAVPYRLDLVGVPCPLSWAKAKVVLADLSAGDLLELTLDDPRGARDLPRAAGAGGHPGVPGEARPDPRGIVLGKGAAPTP